MSSCIVLVRGVLVAITCPPSSATGSNPQRVLTDVAPTVRLALALPAASPLRHGAGSCPFEPLPDRLNRTPPSHFSELTLPARPCSTAPAGTVELADPRSITFAGTQPTHPKEGSTMSKATRPVPAGHESLIPHLVCDPCADAMEFYKRAFGAEEIDRVPAPTGAGSCTRPCESAAAPCFWSMTFRSSLAARRPRPRR
jgi:hypothetical protein